MDETGQDQKTEQMLPSLENQKKFLGEIFKASPDVFIIGGVAVDILLNGSLTQPHKDIDMMADSNFTEQIVTGFENLGCHVVEVAGNVPKLEITRGDIKSSVGLLQKDNAGNSTIVLNAGGKPYQVNFGPSLTGEKRTVDGGMVNIVSPEGLMKTLNAFSAVGLPMDEKHIADREHIQQKYFPSEKPDSPKFLPQVINITP